MQLKFLGLLKKNAMSPLCYYRLNNKKNVHQTSLELKNDQVKYFCSRFKITCNKKAARIIFRVSTAKIKVQPTYQEVLKLQTRGD